MRLALALCVAALPAMADDPPPADFFQGRYQMIGRDADGLIDDQLRMDTTGAFLALSSCGHGAGRLDWGHGPESEFRFLTGTVGAVELNCLWFVDYDNYPLLNCWGSNQALLTLWPNQDGFSDVPLNCRK